MAHLEAFPLFTTNPFFSVLFSFLGPTVKAAHPTNKATCETLSRDGVGMAYRSTREMGSTSVSGGFL